MGIVVGATFRWGLLVACLAAMVLSGATVSAAEEPAPATEKVDAAKKDGEAAAEKDKKENEEAAEGEDLDPPVPTAEEIAKRNARAEDYKTLGEKFFKFPVTGSLYSGYSLRVAKNVKGSSLRNGPDEADGDNIRPTHDTNSDQDIRQYLTMDFGDPDKHVAIAHFDLQVDTDLDGYKRRRDFEGEVDRRDPLISIADTFAGPVYYRLDSAYMDFNHIPGISKLRVGRQYTYETPEVLEFDGVRLDTQPFFGDKELVFSFYGGRSVHNYEITDYNLRSRSIEEFNNGFTDDVILHDLTYGASAEGRPWEGGRMRLDWQHLTDQIYDPYVGSTHAKSDEMTLNVWHTFQTPNLQINGRVSVLDGQLRDTFARASYYKEDWRLHVSASYQGYYFDQDARYSSHRRANGTLLLNNYPFPDPLPLELDPFTQVLGEMQDYQQGNLMINKEWTDNFSTEFGFTMRRVSEGPDTAWGRYFPDDDGKTVFNNDFESYSATLDIHDLPKDFSFSLGGSYYDGRGYGSDILNLNGQASYDWNKQLRTTVGADWEIYSYDLRGIEYPGYPGLGGVAPFYVINRWMYYCNKDDSTQSYFLRQRYQPTRWATLDLGYQFEHSRTAKFHTFTASFRFDF